VDLVAPEGWEADAGGEDGADKVGGGAESPRHAPEERCNSPMLNS
jgi:hypothetical protein